MEVFILTHEETEETDTKSEIIGVYSMLASGIEAYGFYLDNLESSWRKEEEPAVKNTFNRFSEVVNDCIAKASCNRELNHCVMLMRYPVD